MNTRRRPRPAPVVRPAFAGFRFPSKIIVLAVRWYMRFGLSTATSTSCSPSAASRSTTFTIHRWVQRFSPPVAHTARLDVLTAISIDA